MRSGDDDNHDAYRVVCAACPRVPGGERCAVLFGRQRHERVVDRAARDSEASNDGTVHLWDASPAAALAGICADAGQQLTRGEWATYVPGLTYRAPC